MPKCTISTDGVVIMANISDFELTTLPGLFRWYDQSPRHVGFRAQPGVEAETWQRDLRDVIMRLLGDLPAETPALDPHLIEVVDTEHFRREYVVIQTQAGEYMPCYVLIPHQAQPPYKPVIALHGHGSWGARGIIGMAASELENDFIKLLQYDYAPQLALPGYLVFCPG